jgi:regulator of nucleoside diphosphate kinase
VGAAAVWRQPDGRQAQARVLAILFQPEASGDYTR